MQMVTRTIATRYSPGLPQGALGEQQASIVQGRVVAHDAQDQLWTLQLGSQPAHVLHWGEPGAHYQRGDAVRLRQSLLNYGIASSYVSGGQLRVERAITSYQKNAWNQADPSYLDSEAMHTLTEITRRLRNRITQKYPRHKLANDGTRFGAGQAIVTPSVIRGELLAEYSEMEEIGLVENAKLFAKYLVVERDSGNPNRINVLLPPDLVNQLRIFALLNQFRLNYSAKA